MTVAREVSKFRRVVALLASPDPLVYGGVIFGGASPLLSQALPMVDESPFAALPDGTEIPGVAAGVAARRATALDAASPVLAVGKAPGLERRVASRGRPGCSILTGSFHAVRQPRERRFIHHRQRLHQQRTRAAEIGRAHV